MRNDLTDITILLDRSGSMGKIRAATISGFNEFLAAQKASTVGQVNLTLVQFDHEYSPLFTARPLAEVQDLNNDTFQPRGSTALVGALGLAIEDTGKRLAAMPESEQPGSVLFLVVTDGEENHTQNVEWGRRFLGGVTAKAVKHQEEAYSWKFIYLGANHDAIAAAMSLGIDPNAALRYGYNAVGTAGAFKTAARSSDKVRMASVQGVHRTSASLLDEEDRKVQQAAGVS